MATPSALKGTTELGDNQTLEGRGRIRGLVGNALRVFGVVLVLGFFQKRVAWQ